MPRQARAYSDTGIYHVMIRGNEKRTIFIDNEDKYRFINILFEKTAEEAAEIYAYCLMSNHVHLLLRKEGTEIARLMKRINVSFAYYFNKKYKRVGHLFQDRFKSEIVDDEEYLLAVVRYIHNNPVKAGIVNSSEEYWWSSYRDYTDKKKRNDVITDKILKIFSDNNSEAVKLFIEFDSLDSDINFIEFSEKSYEELKLEKEKNAKEFFNNALSARGINIDGMAKRENMHIRNEIIINLKSAFDLSARQMESITKISKDAILRIYKQMIETDKGNRPL